MREPTARDRTAPVEEPTERTGESESTGGRDEGRRRSSWLFRLLFGLAVLLGVAFLVANRAEGRELVELVTRVEPRWLALAIALQAGTYLADAVTWERVLARAEERQPFGWLVRLSFAKFFVDQFVPTGGVTGTILVMRSLEKGGVSRGASVAGMVIRLASYYLAYALALGAAMAIAASHGHVPDVLLAVGAAMIAVFVVLPVGVIWLLREPDRTMPRWLDRLLDRRPLGKLRPSIDAMREASPAFLRDGPLLGIATGAQLLIHVLDAATLWVLLLALGVDAGALVAYAGYMLGFLAGSIGIIPAGVGAFEAGAVGGLNLMGVPATAALTATLLFRGLSLWLPLLPGLVIARRESFR